ncbi:hypothetical protein C9374_004798 [Naegleria lovaniensis]|uniref:Fumarylacetoacetase-like C-terminal domain-containing protein n=1 Tax=Naegleria lovaniensis TaxID=51637 RepID=A0AA88GKV1_NAELO|nr:uncharacterized protein C9374_004798 [Naegleria lovaniensis]KAG2382831.1 hypothetical protein C9374_004798 [Naegleria lovaniensis]
MQAITARTRKIVCLLKNYEAHAKEMKGSVPSNPEFFLKPTTSIQLYQDHQMNNQNCIQVSSISHLTNDVHHEVELGVVIGKKGKNISEQEAFHHVKGFFIALDMTARDLQAKAKNQGKPWTVAKGFDTFCPIGSELLSPTTLIKDGRLINLALFLKVNGVMRQHGYTDDMVHSIPKSIAAISEVMTLEEDDLILTGTPEGVAQVKPGDVIEFGVEGHTKTYSFNVV